METFTNARVSNACVKLSTPICASQVDRLRIPAFSLTAVQMYSCCIHDLCVVNLAAWSNIHALLPGRQTLYMRICVHAACGLQHAHISAFVMSASGTALHVRVTELQCNHAAVTWSKDKTAVLLALYLVCICRQCLLSKHVHLLWA